MDENDHQFDEAYFFPKNKNIFFITDTFVICVFLIIVRIFPKFLPHFILERFRFFWTDLKVARPNQSRSINVGGLIHYRFSSRKTPSPISLPTFSLSKENVDIFMKIDFRMLAFCQTYLGILITLNLE